mmetsp:Transcript_6287/g.16220  ORF Transcript_6287/g.16220 Transcript_6287/m.16220 type:complete len:240 (-) Transcript_6287:796-1515(-)
MFLHRLALCPSSATMSSASVRSTLLAAVFPWCFWMPFLMYHWRPRRVSAGLLVSTKCFHSLRAALLLPSPRRLSSCCCSASCRFTAAFLSLSISASLIKEYRRASLPAPEPPEPASAPSRPLWGCGAFPIPIATPIRCRLPLLPPMPVPMPRPTAIPLPEKDAVPLFALPLLLGGGGGWWWCEWSGGVGLLVALPPTRASFSKLNWRISRASSSQTGFGSLNSGWPVFWSTLTRPSLAF